MMNKQHHSNKKSVHESKSTLTPDADENYLPADTSSPAIIGLWVFMAVITMLFFLFTVAYKIRMSLNDWQPLNEPWQLSLSTAMLFMSCVAMANCRRRAALLPSVVACRSILIVAVLLTLGFVFTQLWAWQYLVDQNITVDNNPANSFFYLLTGLHGLHVLGGLAALFLVIYNARKGHANSLYQSLHLCTRYWHFLLLIWLFLLGLLRFT